MKAEMKPKNLILAVLVCALLWTVSAAAAPKQNVEKIKTGKRGEITLSKATKVGDVSLQPDTYVVQHRVSGADHFVRFMELKTLQDLDTPSGEWTTYTEANNAGEIKCRAESAGATVKATEVTISTADGNPRITQLAIKGENVVHVF